MDLPPQINYASEVQFISPYVLHPGLLIYTYNQKGYCIMTAIDTQTLDPRFDKSMLEKYVFITSAHCTPIDSFEIRPKLIEIQGLTFNTDDLEGLLLKNDFRDKSKPDIAIWGSLLALEGFADLLSSQRVNNYPPKIITRREKGENDASALRYIDKPIAVQTSTSIYKNGNIFSLSTDPKHNLMPGTSGSPGVSGNNLSVVSQILDINKCINEKKALIEYKVLKKCVDNIEKSTITERLTFIQLLLNLGEYNEVYENNPEYLAIDLLTKDKKFNALRGYSLSLLRDYKLVVSAEINYNNLIDIIDRMKKEQKTTQD